MRTIIVTPTFNEREALPGTLRRLLTALPHVDTLIVDDGSPDGTGTWAEQEALRDEAAEGRRRIHVLHRASKQGLGPAYLEGFAWALERGYEVIGEMDADASHRPEQLHRLLDAVDAGADLAIGSRWVPGGRVHNWPAHREVLSRGANIYARLMLGLTVHDATAGFRAFRADLLRTVLAGDAVASQGYCFQVDMTRRADGAGARIVEVPIDFDERTEGASKMSSAIVREALVRVTQWGAAHHGRRLQATVGGWADRIVQARRSRR
ncbi:polyprenol monophosphomannose synthase [Helcobacillus sp. ACRRO]|uniref:polyprenol monophosphomannose synthase n=1 Tax=Helcobacillus sp. ACRRO TaxID=2918202 RepID=UPI001EF6E813|nr:polyprenol monophosphomannose synthase [Helcobacillus sp. ACRRO]MCG7426933.1 polyprenol monophosphomannose synthase [Helcobacillus sp. ACRRO]